MADAAALLGEVRAFASLYELARLEEAVDQFCGCVSAEKVQIADHGVGDEGALKLALEAMRNARAFPAIERLCNRLLKLGCTFPFLRRFYAQALIDRDSIPLAIDVLGQLKVALKATAPPDDPEHKSHPEYAEAQGLLGRCYKQTYIDNVDAVPAERRDAAAGASARQFDSAVQHYVSMVDLLDVTRTDWHAINVVAMMVRAKRDGLGDFKDGIEAWAGKFVTAYEPVAETTDNPWMLATLGEAQAALGNWTQASKWLARFAEHDRVDAFMLYGTIRQLEQLYGCRAGDEDTAQLLTVLKHRLATVSRGQVNFSRGERDGIAALDGLTEQQLEARLGKEGPRKVKWLKQAFQAARAIARVRDKAQQESELGLGTGFLVRGRTLAPSLGEEIFLLTNAHVIAQRRDRTAITPHMARLTFDEAPGLVLACKEVVWSSPFDELDASLVRLQTGGVDLPGVIDLEAFEYFPSDFGELSPSRLGAYIIGHPEGGDLSISLDDAEIVDLGRRRTQDAGIYVHYKTPTEHGSSGSPVFNNDWRVVALHHAGPPRQANGRPQGLRRLGGRGGFHWANEGIALASIAAAMRTALG